MTYGETYRTTLQTNTAEEIVPTFEQPDGIDYLRAPFGVVASPHPEGIRYDVQIEHDALGAHELHDFVRHIAPYNDNASIFGIVADWDIVDRSNSGQDVAQKLVNLHEHLGEAWSEFAKSRPLFLRVLHEGMEFWPERHLRAHAHTEYFVTEKDINTHRMIADVLSRRGEELSILESALEQSGVVDPKTFVLDAIRGGIHNSRDSRRQLQRAENVLQQFSRRSGASKSRFIQEIVRNWPEESRGMLMETLRDTLYQSVTMDDGETYYILRTQIRCDAAEQVKNAAVRRQGPYEAKIARLQVNPRVSYIRTPTSEVEFVVPGSVKIVAPMTAIEPKLSWVKRPDGSRKFIIDRERVTGTENRFKDGVLGVLLAAYFAPEVRETWPTKMSIRGSKPQELGGAQVPVLALFPHAQKQLLQSNFVTGAERLAR